MAEAGIDSRSSIDALLTEHFRYTPLSLIDDIINTVNAIIYRAIQAIENGLLSTPPQALGFGVESSANLLLPDADGDSNVDFPEARDEIENGVHQLETLLEATVDKNFDKFEIYTLRNILTVPDDLAPWIRLAHYRDLTLPLSPSAPTPDSILALRRKLQETQKLNLALEHEHARHSALLSQVRSLLGQPPNPSPAPTKVEDGHSPSSPSAAPFEFLASHVSGAQSRPLSTSAQFTAAQLPALRALLAKLKPKLSTLPPVMGQLDWESGRELRRDYIDGVVRRVVRENGVEEVVEERELGRRVVGEEVRDLESIVNSMGGQDEMEE
ncbi:hypothetical protein MMC30_004285 [Trapelia coarctata]|nr:hypothetical protein [Trapelia coarctata]